MAILAVVLLVHQPIYVLTQFLIARAQQRAIAVVSIVVTVVNLILSFVLAWTWGLPGVAVSTLATDGAMLLWIVPRIAAPASGSTSADLVRAIVRPVLPASVAAVVILVGLARWWDPTTLLALVPLGVVWTIGAGAAIWRFGFVTRERDQFRRELWRGGRAVATAAPEI
jgi:O-antigen/teichoic acid export membrane protein